MTLAWRMRSATVTYNIPPAKPIEHWRCARALADALGGCRSWKAHSRNVATASYIHGLQLATPVARICAHFLGASIMVMMICVMRGVSKCIIHTHTHTHTSCRALRVITACVCVSRIIIVYHIFWEIYEGPCGVYYKVTIL